MQGKNRNPTETIRTSHVSMKEGSMNRLSPRMNGEIYENRSAIILSIEADNRQSNNSPGLRTLQKLPLNGK